MASIATTRDAHNAGPTASQDAGNHARRRHERDQHRVKGQIEPKRQRRKKRELGEQGSGPRVAAQSQSRGEQALQGALEQVSPDDGAAARSHRQMNRHLPPRRGCSRKHYPAEIRGCGREDQQRQSAKDGGEQHRARPLRSSQDRGHGSLQSPFTPRLRQIAGERRRSSGQRNLELSAIAIGQRVGRKQALAGVRSPVASEDRIAVTDWHPDIHAGAEEARRSQRIGDANDGECGAVEVHDLAEGSGRRAESTPPERFRHDGNGRGGRVVVRADQAASKPNTDAGQAEVTAVDDFRQRLRVGVRRPHDNGLEADGGEGRVALQVIGEALQFDERKALRHAALTIHGRDPMERIAVGGADATEEQRVGELRR